MLQKCLPVFLEWGKYNNNNIPKGYNFLPAGKSCPLWLGSGNRSQPVISISRLATSMPLAGTSEEARGRSTNTPITFGSRAILPECPQNHSVPWNHCVFLLNYSMQMPMCVPLISVMFPSDVHLLWYQNIFHTAYESVEWVMLTEAFVRWRLLIRHRRTCGLSDIQ